MIHLTKKLFGQVLTLVTFAVHEHYETHLRKNGKPQSDSGWEDAYRLMEALEEAREEAE